MQFAPVGRSDDPEEIVSITIRSPKKTSDERERPALSLMETLEVIQI